MNSNIILVLGGILSSLIVYFCISNPLNISTNKIVKKSNIPINNILENNNSNKNIIDKNITSIVENNVSITKSIAKEENNKRKIIKIDNNNSKTISNVIKINTKLVKKENKEKIKHINIKKIQRNINKILKRNAINFKFNSNILTAKSKKTLKKIAKMLNKEKVKFDIKVEGHSDGYGNASYNLKLSQKRADSVKQYLTKQCKNIHYISAKGYGFKKPKYKNKKDRRNRRVEIIIKKGII